MDARTSPAATTLVWVDRDEAIIVSWADQARLERVGGALPAFLDAVAARVPETDDVVVVGPGTIRQRLERQLRRADREEGRSRVVRSAASERLTEQELVAHVRELAGVDQGNHQGRNQAPS
jgi:hypothetical protein